MISSYSVYQLPFLLGAVMKLLTTVSCPGIERVICALTESDLQLEELVSTYNDTSRG
jgi:hypothetical protein